MKFDFTVPIRCEYCGHVDSFNVNDYSRRATKINSNFDWVCPACGSIGHPEVSCRMKWVRRQ